MESIVSVVERTRKRRASAVHGVPEGWIVCINMGPIPFHKGILKWIDEFTTGRFYVDPCTLAFEDSEDAVIFNMGFGKPEDRL